MIQGVSGYFDIVGTSNFSGRFFYEEKYDHAGKRRVSITGISIQMTKTGGTWYPHGTVQIDGVTVGQMRYSSGYTHAVSGGMSENWFPVTAREGVGQEFPWESGEIGSNQDGTMSIAISVDITMYHNTSTSRPTIKGSQVIELTKINLGPRAFVRRNGAYAEVFPRLKRAGAWVQPWGKIGGK